MRENFVIKIETMHLADRGETENVCRFIFYIFASLRFFCDFFDKSCINILLQFQIYIYIYIFRDIWLVYFGCNLFHVAD